MGCSRDGWRETGKWTHVGKWESGDSWEEEREIRGMLYICRGC